MKYKVGNKVRVKSSKWYEEHKDKDGEIYIPVDDDGFIADMAIYCGIVATVVNVNEDYPRGYYLDIDAGKWHWTDGMLEDTVV